MVRLEQSWSSLDGGGTARAIILELSDRFELERMPFEIEGIRLEYPPKPEPR